MSASATLSLGYVAIYVVLAGVASFIEKPAGHGFGAFQLDALIRAGSLAAALVALVFARVLARPLISGPLDDSYTSEWLATPKRYPGWSAGT